MRTILDTDIGTDVDDSLALALILASPEIDLIGITCVYGDVNLRAKIALKYLELAGVNDVLVYAGATNPLLKLDKIYWEGHEGHAILGDDDDQQPESQFAVDYLVETILDNPDEIHVIAIGPLTNIAMALQKSPQITDKIAHLTIMGGVIRGYDDLSLPIAEHNIKCDPDSAHVVLTSGMPITLVPLNITVQTALDQTAVELIRSGGSTFHDAVATELEQYPRFIKYGETSPHDPLAVATLIQPELVSTQTVTAMVDLSQQGSRGAIHFKDSDDGTVQLVNSVDSPTFKALLLSRLETPL